MYEAQLISQRYGSVQALHEVSIAIDSGEVHALLGANGAGKSTLMKVLAGAERPTSGNLRLDGRPVAFADTGAAAEQGIAWVAQELTVFGHLDVLENLFLTREPRRGPLLDRREMRRLARPYLQMVGLDEDLSGPLAVLRLGERQRVEICRALLREPQVLILDEPTSALDAGETQRLLEVVRGLRTSGVGVVFVSHFLEDVFAIADTITVLRDGRTVLDGVPRAQLAPRAVIDAMLGERPTTPGARPGPGQPVRRPTGPDRTRSDRTGSVGAGSGLRLHEVTVEGVLEPLTLNVERGEVVALAGLEGSGASAVLRVLYGQLGRDGGRVELPGGRPAPRSPAAAVRAGVALIPADRGRQGLFGDQSVAENVAVVRTLALTVDRLLLRTAASRDRAAVRVRQLTISPGRVDLPVRALSGGNQQKVVFAKWLEAAPVVYLLDDPTRGVDVGTRAQMHEVIRGLAGEQAVVLIVSSDLDELCAVADRAVVFFHGRAVGQLAGDDLNPHRLLEAINTGALAEPAATSR